VLTFVKAKALQNWCSGLRSGFWHGIFIAQQLIGKKNFLNLLFLGFFCGFFFFFFFFFFFLSVMSPLALHTMNLEVSVYIQLSRKATTLKQKTFKNQTILGKLGTGNNRKEKKI
jgi:hypothetical protein